MRQQIRWFALHGVIRGLANYGARRGDPQARLIADPGVRENPAAFADEYRSRGPVIRCRAALMTFDHGVAHELLRSDDFRVIAIGGNLPRPLRWIVEKTETGTLHPLQPPSLLSVEPPDHTRYRKLVSSVFTPRAVATLRERVEQTATALLDELEGETDVVDIVERYCSQLPVAVIGDILGVPDEDRPRILYFGELGAPSLDIGVSWRQYV
ncbi:MAG: cytochrome P450, partial [Mycobacterium sp.]